MYKTRYGCKRMATIVFNQIVIMFIILILGVICSKTGIITEQMIERLSVLLMQVVSPVIIFSSYQSDFSKDRLGKLLWAFALSALAHIIQIVVSHLLIRKKRPDSEVERLSAIYSNCGFFGIPLVWGVFGKEGVFYLTAYMTVFSLFFWTHGVLVVTGSTTKKQMAKNLLSPAIIGVFAGLIFFLAQIRLPALVLEAMDLVGDLNTPLAMLVAGASVAQSGGINGFKELRLYRTTAIRLIVVPIAVVAAFSFIPVDPMILLVIIMAAAAPSGASNTMLAIRFGRNGAYASRIFVITTLLAIATIAPVVALAQVMGIVV